MDGNVDIQSNRENARSSWQGLVLLAIFLLLSNPASPAKAPARHKTEVLRVSLASTAASGGVFEHLAEIYQYKYPNTKIKIHVRGGLTVLEQARQGNADLVVTHLPASEKLFIDEGYGVSRTLIMYNEFILLGPKNNMKLVGEHDLYKVLHRIADNEVDFLVPHKRSGTFKKIDEIWLMTGIVPDWIGYESTGTSAVATLRTAAEFGAYTFIDMSTYLTNRSVIQGKLIPVYRDHAALRNYYSGVIVSQNRFAEVNQPLAEKFLHFLVSDEAQNEIRTFSEQQFGAQIFVPAAHMDVGLKNKQIQQQLADHSHTIRILAGLIAVLLLLVVGIFVLYKYAKKLDSHRRKSEERFELAVNGSSDGIWDWQIEPDVAYFSPRLHEILGQAATLTVIQNPLDYLKQTIHPLDKDNVMQCLQTHLAEDKQDVFLAEFRVAHSGHDIRWVMMRGTAIRNAQGRPTRMTGSMTDITQTVRQKSELKHQSLHDSLTNLPNRVLLLDRIEQTIKYSARNKKSFAILIMDLNRFKEINDALGHPVGDEVLNKVAQRLQKALRKSDTIARMGGDEFAFLLPDANEVVAKHVAQKISLVMKDEFEIGDHKMYIDGSIGICLYPDHGADARSLIQHADMAMYVAKQAKVACAVYDVSQSKHSERHFRLEKDLHEAIRNDALMLHYQPKIDLRHKTIIGVEALLRWKHPEFGMVPPDEVVGIAEHSELIKHLTNWVLDAATKQMAAWQKQGLRLNVAVNLSVLDIQDCNLISQVKRCLKRWNIPVDLLELEITETAMMSNLSDALVTLEQLDKMGIALAIDDFGTGHSSLAYLKRLPVSHLKIDRTFVGGMKDDESDASIVRSTIELAHSLNMSVIAEGIEDKETLELLEALGCEMAQGYYFAKPLSAQELVQWIHDSPWQTKVIKGLKAIKGC